MAGVDQTLAPCIWDILLTWQSDIKVKNSLALYLFAKSTLTICSFFEEVGSDDFAKKRTTRFIDWVGVGQKLSPLTPRQSVGMTNREEASLGLYCFTKISLEPRDELAQDKWAPKINIWTNGFANKIWFLTFPFCFEKHVMLNRLKLVFSL